MVAASAPSIGHCNTMGTATTMNALAEALGMSLPGCAAIPAPYRERGQIAYETAARIVSMVREDLRPSDIMTRDRVRECGGGRSRDRRLDQLRRSTWSPSPATSASSIEDRGLAAPGAGRLPLLVNMQPAGVIWARPIPSRRRRAGGDEGAAGQAGSAFTAIALTVNGKSIADNLAGLEESGDRRRHPPL
jgi:hypothetical protein